jgi:LDH2 family malate/lactate/ureidoglycolate dehydrogenase
MKPWHIPANLIADICRKIFVQLGTSAVDAAYVSKMLVSTSLAGIDSHGIILIDRYVKEIENNIIQPKNAPTILKDENIFTLVDGNHGFGQVTSKFGIGYGIKKAQAEGISITSLTNTNHIGRVGEYALDVAEKGLMCFAVANAGPNVAPFGSFKKLLGTNPIAFACPASDGAPILVDLATSLFPEGKVRSFLNQGIPLPDGVVIDKNGKETSDPADLYAGGSLLPIGLYKGYGLSIMVEILGGLFSGAGSSALGNAKGINGAFFMVINPYQFVSKGTFDNEISSFIDAMKSQPVIDGVKEVMMPGEPERLKRVQREKAGIPVNPKMWSDILAAAKKCNITIEYNPESPVV